MELAQRPVSACGRCAQPTSVTDFDRDGMAVSPAEFPAVIEPEFKGGRQNSTGLVHHQSKRIHRALGFRLGNECVLPDHRRARGAGTRNRIRGVAQ